MTQKTKIIATLGPASHSSRVLEDMIIAGASVFRFNLKHNNHEWHAELANRLRGIAKKLNKNIALLADLQGPELRIGMLPNNIDKRTNKNYMDSIFKYFMYKRFGKRSQHFHRRRKN